MGRNVHLFFSDKEMELFMSWIDILNYQPLGGMRIMHYIMLYILVHIIWMEVKVYLDNRD